MVFYDDKHKYDYKEKDHKQYPCFKEFYEAQYACSDDIFEFMMELSYAKQTADSF